MDDWRVKSCQEHTQYAYFYLYEDSSWLTSTFNLDLTVDLM